VPPDGELITWLANAMDFIHDKLAEVGLVEPRTAVAATVATFTRDYIGSRVDVKPRTKLNLEDCANRLVEFFKADRALATIGPGEADDFCAQLQL
jgi:hypothetical protein